MTVAAGSAAATARRLLLTGLVQGVGMRPHIAQLATGNLLNGQVRNTHRGVEIHIEGGRDQLDRFCDALLATLPDAAELATCHQEEVPVRNLRDFTITETSDSSVLATRIPADRSICHVCAHEILSGTDRRFQHPFATCVDCGPRYSLIDSMPFDRDATTMRDFDQCPACETETRSSSDRRYHCQTNGCPRCGPQIFFRDHVTRQQAHEALLTAAGAIKAGQIIAMKGIGGFQLLCDATSDIAVTRLRQQKGRPTKPFAVMVDSLSTAHELAELSDAAVTALTAPANPVVVAPSRVGRLSAAIAPGTRDMGIFLPSSALHLLLLREVGRPCVCTSGNVHDNPIEFQRDSWKPLLKIADGVLDHTRRVSQPVDDSVVRVGDAHQIPIRLGRGMAPLSLPAQECAHRILATGGHQKVAVALSTGTEAILGPHIADMNTVTSRERFVQHVDRLCQLYQTEPTVVVHDLHPDYFTTQWALQSGLPTIAVQHHHAHVAAGMLEHGWLDREVIGVAFDGTGYGADGTIQGGEFLRCSTRQYQRVARLMPFPLPGGERAIHQPSRISEVLCRIANGEQDTGSASSISSPLTSSLGRLFDGVAAMVLGIDHVSFEGEAAMMLESACTADCRTAYEVPIIEREIMELDWRPMVRNIDCDIRRGVSAAQIATRFHQGIADAVKSVCSRFSLPVVLTGGCFQNELLLKLVSERLSQDSIPTGIPAVIPPNDGGLAAGQLVVASAILRQSDATKGTL